jgi:hypothetical protein
MHILLSLENLIVELVMILLQDRVILVCVRPIPRAEAWVAFYSPGGHHLFPYNLGNKLYKVGWLFRVVQVCRGLEFHHYPVPCLIGLA